MEVSLVRNIETILGVNVSQGRIIETIYEVGESLVRERITGVEIIPNTK